MILCGDVVCDVVSTVNLKVAQVNDEMDGDEDDGCNGVCDVAW